jgi:hypothetical protein
MQPSIFNVRVPLRDQSDVFLMNTLTDAQIIVPPEVVSLLDSIEAARSPVTPTPACSPTRNAKRRHPHRAGFVVESHAADRRAPLPI